MASTCTILERFGLARVPLALGRNRELFTRIFSRGKGFGEEMGLFAAKKKDIFSLLNRQILLGWITSHQRDAEALVSSIKTKKETVDAKVGRLLSRL